MIYRFAGFELDTAKVELRADGVAVAVEPQVFSLLTLLVENRDRLITKDEIIERVWGGRIISDSAVASRIKSARHALGDDGRAQRFIRTTHGVGFRFVANVDMARVEGAIAQSADASPSDGEPAPIARPSIAVLPFGLLGQDAAHATIADALAHDVTTALSRLHWLFVIARESSFRLRGAQTDINLVRAALNVRYCLSGAVEILNETISVSVELCDTFDRGVVWSDRFRGELAAVHDIRDGIASAVLNALELQIPLNEARRARLLPPDHLDAWSSYHLGLQHMFRFNKNDNATATAMFERAVALEPSFARGYAGLSFTHFQDAFLHYATDAPGSAERARRYAEQCLERDSLDPFGNFNMGRTFWLRGDLDGSLPWLERAIALNPNYAQAKYARAWTLSLLGDVTQSLTDVDAAAALSPLDPFLYGMHGVRAFCFIGSGDNARAAKWAERAARTPGAHALIELIAAVAHGLNGDDIRARAWMKSARIRAPNFDAATFIGAFPFHDQGTRERIVAMLRRLGG